MSVGGERRGAVAHLRDLLARQTERAPLWRAGQRGQNGKQRLEAHLLQLRQSGQDKDPAAHKSDTE